VEAVERLNNWQLSRFVEGVIDQMDLKDSMKMDEVELEVVE